MAVLAALAAAAPAADAGPGLTLNGRPAPASLGRVVRLAADGSVLLRQDALRALAGVEVAAEGHVLTWFDATLTYRPGASRFSLGPGQLRDAGTQPLSADGTIWLPAQMLAEAFGWRVEVQGQAVAAWAPSAAVTGIRQGIHDDRVRMVVDLGGPCAYQVLREADQVTLLLPPPPNTTATAGQLRLLEFASPVVPRVAEQVEADGWSRLAFSVSGAEKVTVFSIGDPARIVLDLAVPPAPAPAQPEGQPQRAAPLPAGAAAPTDFPSPRVPAKRPPAGTPEAAGGPPAPAAEPGPPQPAKPEAPPKPPSLADGEWRTVTWPTGAGATTVHVVAFDPAHGKLELRPALAGDSVMERASVARIASAAGAVAAVNGGFFAPGLGVPLGMLVIDREWIRAPHDGRPVFAIMADGRCAIARVRMVGRAIFHGLGFLSVDALNANHPPADSIVLYTRRFGSTVPGTAGSTRLIISGRGRVIFREADGRDVAIPPDGMVLSGTGARAASLKKVPLGCRARVEFRTDPPWPSLRHALGGGPLLVADGTLALDPGREGFRSDVASGRHARTALGITREGRVVLVAAEGGKGGRGSGMTLTELARLMLDLHCRMAMNLDGGGSTTLFYRGEVVTNCSDGSPRAVSNALVLVPRHPNGKG